MAREFTLVSFAVKEEAVPFRRLVLGRPDISILVTGMGRKNAAQAIRQTLAQQTPELMITAGFAGGLAKSLAANTVLFDSRNAPHLDPLLRTAGAIPGKFECSNRVAATAAEKQQLYATSGADAVEMESAEIATVAREAGIACATVRVILDTADSDLPVDFNALLTADLRLSGTKMALAILRSPSLIPKLIRFQKESGVAAEALAQVLFKVLSSTLQPR